MYPGTIFNWHDNSVITENVIDTVDNSPLYLALSSFDRGPEDLRIVSGREFYNLYGTKMNFEKHGQPALQIANMIDGGARVLVKRLVASDAKLANLIAVANLSVILDAVESDDDDAQTIDEIIGKSVTPTNYAPLLPNCTALINSAAEKIKVNIEVNGTNSFKYAFMSSNTQLELNAEFVGEDLPTDGLISAQEGKNLYIVEVDDESKVVKCAVFVPAPAPTTNVSEAVAGIDNTFEVKMSNLAAENNSSVSFTNPKPTNPVYWKVLADGETVPENIDDTWTSINATSMVPQSISVSTNDKVFFVTVEDEVDLKVIGAAVVTAIANERATAVKGEEPDTSKKYKVESKSCEIKWIVNKVDDITTSDAVLEAAKEMYKEDEPQVEYGDEEATAKITLGSNYPLIVISDNGRGTSNKRVKFIADNATSKSMSNVFYTLAIFDGTSSVETVSVTLNPACVYANTLYGLNEDTTTQLRFDNVDGAYNAFIAKLAENSNYSEEELIHSDLIFAKDFRGNNLRGITLSKESVIFGDYDDSTYSKSPYGVALQGGNDGLFADKAFGTTEWEAQAIATLSGSFDDSIWDTDLYKIAAVFDANYPDNVKNEIAKFVTFREDCVYFRDYGKDVRTYDQIYEKYTSFLDDYKNKFIADYCTTYQIYDPETKKRITVTMMYDFARCMINHFATGCCRPTAGFANNMILANAIEGTINFTPRITPTINQKSLLDDIHVNYAIFENGSCVVQSLYSSQANFTQLSFINNVLAIQEVLRAVRTACPKQRYTFTSASDFSSYASAVNNVLKLYTANFAELYFEYEQDSLKASQKIFYASIYFRFNNWAQTESFDIYALPNE